MKKTGVFSVMTVLLIIILGMSGCNMEKNKISNDENEIIAEMRTHLSEKYGDINYKLISFVPAGWEHSYDLLNISVEKDGNEYIRVERHKDDNGYYYKDNYFGLLIRDEFENEVLECASKHFDDFMVYADLKSDNYPNSLDDSSTFEDFLNVKEELDHIIFFVIVNDTFENTAEFNNAAKAFVDDWAQIGIASIPRILCVTSEVYENSERTDYDQILNENKYISEYRESVN